jgi:hypothetical protein
LAARRLAILVRGSVLRRMFWHGAKQFALETGRTGFTAKLSFFFGNEFHATFFEHKTFSPHHM